jgi:hypothetical protein
MKRVLLVLTATLALSGCAEDLGYGPSFASGLVYYDGYYGPYYNGYWSRDGFFYYSPQRGRPFVRDQNRHFQRNNPGGGFHGERTRPGWVGHHGSGGAGGNGGSGATTGGRPPHPQGDHSRPH